MKTKIKAIVNKIIYDKLGLEEIENKLVQLDIKNKELNNPEQFPIASKYFFLMNDINLDSLSEQEKEELKSYFNNMDNNKFKLAYEFLAARLNKVLVLSSQTRMILFDREVVVPLDSVILLFHYIKHSSEDLNLIMENEKNISRLLNYIQYNLYKRIGTKVTVLKSTETDHLIPKKIM